MKKLLTLLFAFFTIVACTDDSAQDENINDFSGNSGTFTDARDGHEYAWVRIGNQVWMAENLAYLPIVNSRTEDSSSEPYYYVYEYNGTSTKEAKATDYYASFGVLYNWSAAKISSPEGWHLPSDGEWEQLAQYVSGQKGPYSKLDDDWSGVGKHLKSSSGWNNNGNGTDDFDFSALAGGERAQNGFFRMNTIIGYWWSSTENDSEFSWYRLLADDRDDLFRSDNFKIVGMSVRCIKD